jgi:serine/threonine protein kinase
MAIAFGNDYILLRCLGRGATGPVCLARHRLTERLEALKVLDGRWLAEPTVLARFLQEMRVLAALSHPNLVRVYGAGRAAGTYYLALEYVAGPDLSVRVKRSGPLPVGDACEIICQTARALAYLHRQGLYHRDVKPANILLKPAGRRRGPRGPVVKLCDLSIVRAVCAESRGDEGLTASGSFLGTADFVSPEQAADARGADARSDFYSLGATFYVLLTGELPYPGGTLRDKLARHAGAHQPRPVRDLRPEVPAFVADVVSRLMAKQPAARFQSSEELIAALSGWRLRHNRGDRLLGRRVVQVAARPLATSPRGPAD